MAKIKNASILSFIILLFLVSCTSPPNEVARAKETTSNDTAQESVENSQIVPIDFTKSSFNFTGYGPGKEHKGTFTKLSGELIIQDDKIVKATGTIDAASIKTDGERLQNHLKSSDFFDVEKFPEIVIESTSIKENEISGKITFHGVTKELTFPATVTNNQISADVIISMEDFGISQTFANPDVRIEFSLVNE